MLCNKNCRMGLCLGTISSASDGSKSSFPPSSSRRRSCAANVDPSKGAMDGKGSLMADAAFKDLQKLYDVKKSINILNEFSKDPERFAKFR